MKAKAIHQPIKFRQFGSDNGQMVIYFHGAPGVSEEGEYPHYHLNGRER